MIGKVLPLLLYLGSIVAQYHNVDPNTLKCDPTGQILLLLPHFEDCSKFYFCAHGQEIEKSCGEDTIFDFPNQTCNYTWATQCSLRHREEEEIESGSGEDEFSYAFRNEPAIPIVKQLAAQVEKSNSPLNCKSVENAARRVAYKGDCQRYWRCMEGVPVAQYCSDGLFFNEYKQQCDFEANVKCEDQIYDELNTEFIVYE